jgi:hypothetical protein
MSKSHKIVAILCGAVLVALLGLSIKVAFLHQNVSVLANNAPANQQVLSESKLATSVATATSPESAHVTSAANTTSDWKTYKNDQANFEIRYPDQMNVFPYTNEYSNDVDFNLQLVSNNKSNSITLNVNTNKYNGVSYCYIDLCDVPAESKKVINEITWDYLGSQSYGDAGAYASWPATYRVFYRGLQYYVLASSKNFAEQILSTFKFTY